MTSSGAEDRAVAPIHNRPARRPGDGASVSTSRSGRTTNRRSASRRGTHEAPHLKRDPLSLMVAQPEAQPDQQSAREGERQRRLPDRAQEPRPDHETEEQQGPDEDQDKSARRPRHIGALRRASRIGVWGARPHEGSVKRRTDRPHRGSSIRDFSIGSFKGLTHGRLPRALAGKQWLKLDLKTLGLDAGQLGQANPSSSLDILRGVTSDIQNLGPDTVGGVSTTHYRIQIDLAKALQNTPSSLRGVVQRGMTRSAVLAPCPPRSG